MKNILYISPGGMKCTFSSGVLKGLRLPATKIDEIYTSSAGTVVANAWLNKINTKKLWVDKMTSKSFLSQTIWPPLDLDGLMEILHKNIKPKWHIWESPDIYINILRNNGAIERVLQTKDNFYKAMRGSLTVPVFCTQTEYHNKSCFDGGIVEWLPSVKFLKENNKQNKIIIIHNLPFKKIHHDIEIAAVKVVFKISKHKIIDKKLKSHISNFNNSVDYIEKLQAQNNALVIAPSRPIRCHTFTQNPEKIEKLYEHGVEIGELNRSKVRDFIK